MRRTGWTVSLLVAALTLTLALPAAAQDKLTVRLKWVPQFQSAGFHVADLKGFYKEEGLDVKLYPAGTGAKAPQMVAGGSDHLGIAGPDQILLGWEKGAKFVGLMAVYQASPAAWMVRKNSGIKTLKDWEGKSVAVNYGSQTETEMRAMLKKSGIDTSKIKEVPLKFDLSPFLTGQVDVWACYVTDEPNVARGRGVDVDVFMAKDVGINFYGDVVFAMEDFVKKNPDLVRRFVRASVKGWKYAMEHVDEAIEIVLKVNDKAKKEQLQYEARTTLPLLVNDDTKKHTFGWMSRARWEEIQAIMLEQKLLKQKIDVGGAFTTTFLERVM